MRLLFSLLYLLVELGKVSGFALPSYAKVFEVFLRERSGILHCLVEARKSLDNPLESIQKFLFLLRIGRYFRMLNYADLLKQPYFFFGADSGILEFIEHRHAFLSFLLLEFFPFVHVHPVIMEAFFLVCLLFCDRFGEEFKYLLSILALLYGLQKFVRLGSAGKDAAQSLYDFLPGHVDFTILDHGV